MFSTLNYYDGQELSTQDSDYQTNKRAHRPKYTKMIHSELLMVQNVKQISTIFLV
jgi:hypothetical protein